MAVQLFLASSSPRRQTLLTDWGFTYIRIPNLLSIETLPKTGSKKHIHSQIKKLARQKARCSAVTYSGIILTADTTILCNRHVLEKPNDLTQAQAMLSYLSEKTHQVITAVALLETQTKKCWTYTTTTHIRFRKLEQKQIEDYCKNFEVLDKAGSYAIQDIGDTFIEKIVGSYSNVVGLPKHPTCNYLKQLGIERH